MSSPFLTAAIISVIALVLTATAKSTVLPLTAIALPAISRASPVLASGKFTGLLFPPLRLFMPLRRCLSLPLSARIGTRSAAMLARCDAVRCRRCRSQTAGIGGWCFQKFCATLPSCGCPMPQYRERMRREYCHQQADSVFCDGLQHRSAAGMTVKRRRLCSALSVRIQP